MRSFVLIVIGMLAVAALSEAAVPCKCRCPMIYQPVCAMDRTKRDTDTFPSQCALECYNCTHNTRYEVLKKGECQPQKRS